MKGANHHQIREGRPSRSPRHKRKEIIFIIEKIKVLKIGYRKYINGKNLIADTIIGEISGMFSKYRMLIEDYKATRPPILEQI